MRLRAALLLPLLVVLASCLGAEEPCACTYPAESTTHRIYLLVNGDGSPRLAPVKVTVSDSGDPGLDAARALVEAGELGEKVNGFRQLPGEPITQVRQVVHRDGLVTVYLARSPWDPYPHIDLDTWVTGDLVVQQLVWTVQSALDTDDPVLLTVRGEPARGVLGVRFGGPVAADRSLARRAG